jgi:RNA polymerase sigma-70 factor (sigma-E family)
VEATTLMGEPRIDAGGSAEAALRAAYTTQYGRLVGLARLLVDRRDDAEEVVQEAFARTWAGLGRVHGDPLPYLRRAVVNQSRGRLRRRRTAAAHRPEAARPVESAESGAVRGATTRAVVAGLRTLPRRQRECVVLRFYEDLTVPEIARALGLAEGSVKSHLHRALAALAVELEDQR